MDIPRHQEGGIGHDLRPDPYVTLLDEFVRLIIQSFSTVSFLLSEGGVLDLPPAPSHPYLFSS